LKVLVLLSCGKLVFRNSKMRVIAALLIIIAAATAAPIALAAIDRSNTGATPREAALHYLLPGRGFRLLSTRVAGRFAIVRFAGALMEGDPRWADSLVIERFPFGWQVVDILRSACLGARGATRAEIAALEASNLSAYRDANGHPCSDWADRGPHADVVAVRSVYREPFTVPFVRVVGDYALLDWTLPGGGQAAAIRRAGRWRVVGSGGGAMNATTLHSYGVPLREACALIPPGSYDPPDLRTTCRSLTSSRKR
jgi:hypothetical protein